MPELARPRAGIPTARGLTEYKISRVYGSQCSRAARAAVVTPLLGPGELRDTQKVMARLRKMWQARLYALRKAGWRKLPTHRALAYAANCPPFSVETSTKQRCCRLSWICPFCYARDNVIEPFRAAERYLFGPRKSNVPLRPELRIVWFSTAEHSIRDPQFKLVPAALPHHAAFVRGMMKSRKSEVNHFSAAAGVANYQLSPLGDGGVGVRRTGVLLVPESEALRAAIATYLASGGKCSEEPLPPTKKSLFDAFCRGMQFNRSALYSPPEAAATLLNATRGFRYRTIYGGMRTSKT